MIWANFILKTLLCYNIFNTFAIKEEQSFTINLLNKYKQHHDRRIIETVCYRFGPRRH